MGLPSSTFWGFWRFCGPPWAHLWRSFSEHYFRLILAQFFHYFYAHEKMTKCVWTCKIHTIVRVARLETRPQDVATTVPKKHQIFVKNRSKFEQKCKAWQKSANNRYERRLWDCIFRQRSIFGRFMASCRVPKRAQKTPKRVQTLV